MATHSNAISALQLQLQLQPKLGLGSYKTAWLLLHKLRRAMVNPDRTPLEGEVEVDETQIAFRTNAQPVIGGGGNSPIGKVFVVGAVERLPSNKSGRIRLKAIAANNATYWKPFVEENMALGCEIHTDGKQSYLNLPNASIFP